MARKKKLTDEEMEKIAANPTVDISDIDPEALENARKEMRASMREKFSQWIEVSDETADDAFLQEAKDDFKKEVEKHQNVTYKLAGAEDGLALKTAEFLKSFNEKHNKWEKGSWRGIITFNKVIDNYIKDLTVNPDKDFEIDYSTLIFLYNSMAAPNGIGLESAREMAKMENYNEETDKPFEENIPVTYSGILEKVFEHVRLLSVVDKKLKLYQERVNIAAAGIRFDFKISDLDEFKQLHDAWVTENIPADEASIKNAAAH